MFSLLRTGMLFSALFALSGCGGHLISSLPPAASLQRANDGAVVVRLLPNMPAATRHARHWESLTIERIDDKDARTGEKHVIHMVPGAASQTAVYAGSVPPGRYQLTRFFVGACGPYCEGREGYPPAGLGNFDVATATLTDLGVLIQSNTQAENNRTRILLSHDSGIEHPETTAIVNTFVPVFASTLTRPRLGWNQTSVSAGNAQLFEQNKRDSLGLLSPHELKNGSFLYGSFNGIVYELTTSKLLRAYDTGVRSAIETIFVTSSGEWFVGGELGVLRVSKDHGSSWTAADNGLPFGNVLGVLQWRDKLIATVAQGKELFVYLSPLSQAAWE